MFSEKTRKQFDQALVRIQCKELRDFLETVSDALDRENAELRDYLEQTLAQMEESQEKYEFRQEMEVRIYALGSEHPERIVNACFLGAFFFLEDKLSAIAAAEGKKRNIDLKPSDVGRGGLDGVRIYLKKVCKFTLPENADWEKICRYREIRNCLVHHRGRVGDNKMLRKFLVDSGLKEPKPGKGMIHLSSAFCSDAIDVIEQYVLDIMKKL